MKVADLFENNSQLFTLMVREGLIDANFKRKYTIYKRFKSMEGQKPKMQIYADISHETKYSESMVRDAIREMNRTIENNPYQK